MSLRLSSLTSLSTLAVAAASFLLLANCTSSANIATGGSGGTGGTTSTTTGTGAGTTTSSTTTTTTTTTTSTTGGGGGATVCAQAGGVCEAITPSFCTGGTVGDASKYPCGPGLGDGCCFPGTCESPCSTLGATRCIAGVVETCGLNPNTNCVPTWFAPMACPSGDGCNSDATRCIPTTSTCTVSADCGCGCGCGNGECECTGGIPESCTVSADCGPPCAGLVCIGGQCQQQACTPGMDQTCNENASMNSLAGACSVDGVCTCKAGFTLKADGKCGT